MMKILTSQLTLIVLTFVLSLNAYAQTCYDSPGCLDTTFGIGGEVIIRPPLATNPTSTSTSDMVFQSDGKIVMLTLARDTAVTFKNALVRFTASGSIDGSFADGGFRYITWNAPNTGGGAAKFSIQTVNGEERFVVAGGDKCGTANCVRVERYKTDGTLDTAFGTGGVTLMPAAAWTANVIAIQPADQKILLAGSMSGPSPVARLNADGTPDTSFGPNGISATKSGIGIAELEVLSSGKIVAAGYFASKKSNDFAVARFNPNGTLDTAFGTGGKTIFDFANNSNDFVGDMAVDSAGNILICGESLFPNSRPVTPTGYDAVLIRLTANGTLDPTFGTGGKATPLNIGNLQDYFESVSVLQASGKIVLTGEGRLAGNNANADILTARYNSNGTLDTTYHSTGWNLTDIYGSYDAGDRGLIQYDPACSCEKFVVAAYAQSSLGTYMVGLRYIL